MNIDPVSTYGRVRRLGNRYCDGVLTQIERINQPVPEIDDLIDLQSTIHKNKNEWEALIMFLVRLRRCLVLLGRCRPTLKLRTKHISDFDSAVPDLVALRDFEEHFDDYSSNKGKNSTHKWGHLESYKYGATSFANGVGEISTEAAYAAAKIAWEAILSVETDAKAVGWLSWEDRYGGKTPKEEMT